MKLARDGSNSSAKGVGWRLQRGQDTMVGAAVSPKQRRMLWRSKSSRTLLYVIPLWPHCCKHAGDLRVADEVQSGNAAGNWAVTRLGFCSVANSEGWQNLDSGK